MSHLENAEYKDNLEDFSNELMELKNTIPPFFTELTEEVQEQEIKSFWDIKLHPQDEYSVPWISNAVRQKNIIEIGIKIYFAIVD